MANAKIKPVVAEARDGEQIVVTLVTGDNPGLAVFIPGKFDKPADLPKSTSGRMQMVVATENWLPFRSLLKGWDLVGGIHFGYSKPRAKKNS